MGFNSFLTAVSSRNILSLDEVVGSVLVQLFCLLIITDYSLSISHPSLETFGNGASPLSSGFSPPHNAFSHFNYIFIYFHNTPSRLWDASAAYKSS